MPGTGPRAKHWSFTLNNFTPEDVDRLSVPSADIEYLIFGRETGASGTPHLQGTVCFRSRKRLQQVIAMIGQAHCTVTRFLSRSIVYCKKEGDFTEIGVEPQEQQSKRKERENSEIEEFKDTVKEGTLDMTTLREMHSTVCAQFPKFVNQYIDDHRPRPVSETHPLRPWQQELNNKIRLAPSSREIIFIVDAAGNQGKSWFARYFCDLHETAQIIIPGKKADMALVVRQDATVFFFDCPRSKQGDFIQYDFLEELKNGYIFSPKYESKIKRLAVPHVVVLMNEAPVMDKLSSDRYSVTILH